HPASGHTWIGGKPAAKTRPAAAPAMAPSPAGHGFDREGTWGAFSNGASATACVGASHAVPAQHPVGVSQLARVLHQEARAARELPRPLRGDTEVGRAVLSRQAVVEVVIVVVLVEAGPDAHPLLEDLVEAGLDLVAVGLLVL